MILSVIFNFQMFIFLTHHDPMFQFSLVYHLMLNADKPLLLLVHQVQENQHVYNYYKDSMMQIQVQFLSMENKLMNIIWNGYDNILVLLVKNLFYFRQLFDRIFYLDIIQLLMKRYIMQLKWLMRMILLWLYLMYEW